MSFLKTCCLCIIFFILFAFFTKSKKLDSTSGNNIYKLYFLKFALKPKFVRSGITALINSPAQIKLAEVEDDRDRSGKFAIVEVSGRPRWVEEGRYYDFYRIKQKENKKINLNRIMFYSDEQGKVFLGTPFLENIRVNATVINHFRGKKIHRLKFKRKKHYRRFYGHRQEMTRIVINKIEVNRELVTIDIYKNSEMENKLTTYEKRKFSFFKDDPLFYILNRIHNIVKPSLELKHIKKKFSEYLNLYCTYKFETFYKSKGNYKSEKMLKNILKTKKLSKRPEVIEEVQRIEQEKKERRLKKIDPLEDFDPVVNEHIIDSNF